MLVEMLPEFVRGAFLIEIEVLCFKEHSTIAVHDCTHAETIEEISPFNSVGIFPGRRNDVLELYSESNQSDQKAESYSKIFKDKENPETTSSPLKVAVSGYCVIEPSAR